MVTSRNLPSKYYNYLRLFFSPQNMMTLVFFFSLKNNNYSLFIIHYFILFIFVSLVCKILPYKKKHWFESSWNFGCNFFSFGCLCTHHMRRSIFIILGKLCELSSVHKMMCPPGTFHFLGEGIWIINILGSISSLNNCQNSEMNFCENMKGKPRCWKPS